MVTDAPRPIIEHLQELQSRLIWTLSTWAVAFVAAFTFKERVFELLMGPAVGAIRERGYTLSVIAPPELFFSYVKASLLAGFLVTLPVTLYHGWAFVSPGLYASERRMALPFVVATTGLFALGNGFGYFLAFPFVFEFFLSLEGDYVTTQWTTQAVFAFMSRLYLAFGLAFQLPIVMFFLAAARIVSPDQMVSFRRYAIVAIFVVAAILTPPDVVSQIMLAIPLMILYEGGVLASRLAARRREQPEASGEPST